MFFLPYSVVIIIIKRVGIPVARTMRFGSPLSIYFFLFFAVLAARLKFAFVGAPLAPGFLIFSPEPAAIRFLLAWMFAYNPRLAMLAFPFT